MNAFGRSLAKVRIVDSSSTRSLSLKLAVPMLQAGKLKPVLTDWVAAAPSMKIVYPSNRYLTAKVRAFGDFVAGIYPSKGWWKG